MNNIKIRSASREDLANLGIIGPVSYSEAYGEYWSSPAEYAHFLENYSYPAFASFMSAANLIWVAEHQGHIIGYITVALNSCEPLSNQVFGVELCHLYVLKICRGYGVGEKLFTAALTEIKKSEATYIWLRVMQFAHWASSRYDKWGFDVIGRQTLAIKGFKADKTMLIMKKIIPRDDIAARSNGD